MTKNTGLLRNMIALLTTAFIPSTYNVEPRPGHVASKADANDEGILNIGFALGIAAVIIGAVVGVQIIAALAPTWFGAIADLSATFDTSTTNDTTADSLLPIFRLLVALGGVFAIVGAALLAVRLTRGGDGN